MAWYHVIGCGCPVGCCYCGEPDYKNEKGFIWHDPISNELVINDCSEKYGNPCIRKLIYIGEL